MSRVTERTRAQVEADDALTDAIQTVCRAYDVIDDDQLVMNFVICGYAQGLGDVGRGYQFFQLYRDNGHAGSGTNFEHEGLLREGLRTVVTDSRDT